MLDPAMRLQLPQFAGSPVSVRWLGTAGFEIRAGEHAILIDPYFTRASLARCAFGRLSPDIAAITRNVSRADAIIVGHTHFDHALDVPAIARLTGAKVFGSSSAANLCRADGVPPAQIHDVQAALRAGSFETEIGPFHLRFFPSAHSKLILGRAVPAAGDITDCDHVPTRTGGFKCGAVFAVEIRAFGRSVFHLGSAEIVDTELPAREVDLLLFCVAGWQNSPRVIERSVSRLSPHAVLLSHWDDFFRPLDREVRALPALQLPRVIETFRREARDVKIGAVDLLESVEI